MRPRRRQGVSSRFSRDRGNDGDDKAEEVALDTLSTTTTTTEYILPIEHQFKIIAVEQLTAPEENNASLGSCFVCCKNLDSRDKVSTDNVELLKSIREYIFTPTFFWALPARNFSDEELTELCYHCATGILALRKYHDQVKNLQNKIEFIVKKIQSVLAKKYNVSGEDIPRASSPMDIDLRGMSMSPAPVDEGDIETSFRDVKLRPQTSSSNDESGNHSEEVSSKGSPLKNELPGNSEAWGSTEGNKGDDSDSDSEIVVGDGTSCCELCGKVLRTTSLLSHMKRIHEKIRRAICPVPGCGKAFFDKFELQKHDKSVHSQDDIDLETCEECGKQFKGGRRGYELHRRRVHEKIRDYECKICNAKFFDNGALNRHMVVHTKEKKFKCNVCETSFTEKQSLKTHMDRKICADKVAKMNKLRSLDELVVQEKAGDSESTVNLYKCTYCDKKYQCLRNFKIHVQSNHEGEKKHVCSVCGYKFFRRADLRRHEVVHADVKPFKCDKCERSFSYEKSLEKHKLHKVCRLVKAARLRNKLGLTSGKKIKRSYKCPLCEETRSTKRHIMLHLKKTHSLTEDQVTYYISVVKTLPNLHCENKKRGRAPKVIHEIYEPQQIEISVVDVDADFLKNMK